MGLFADIADPIAPAVKGKPARFADIADPLPKSTEPGAGAVTITRSQQMPDSSAANPADVAEVQQALANPNLTPSERAGLQDVLRVKLNAQGYAPGQAPRANIPGPQGTVNGGLGTVNPHRNMPQGAVPVAHVPGTNDQIPGAVPTSGPGPAETWWDKAKGAMEAGASTASAIPAGIIGNVAGLAHAVGNGADAGEAKAAATTQAIQNWMTAGPMTPTGQRYASNIAAATQDLGAVAPMNEFQALASQGAPNAARAAGDAARSGMDALQQQFTASKALPVAARVEPTMVKPRYGVVNGKIQRIDEGASPATSTAPITAETLTQPVAKSDVQPLLERVLPGQTIRKSVLNGDLNAAAGDIEYARAAKAGDAGAQLMKQAIDNERAGLQKYSSDTIDQTGGTRGMDQQTLITSGKTLAAPADALRVWMDDKIKSFYDVADQRSGGAPAVVPDALAKFLDTSSNFSGKAANSSLRSGVLDYMTEQGIRNKDGSFNPMTVKQAEGVNQYINGQYGHEIAGLSGKLKDAVNQDVFKSAGEDIYAPARNLFKLKKQTLDNPNGISRMFDTDPRTPMNRSTALEDIPSKMMNLSADQLGHIVKVYRTLPPELQPLGQAAIAELQARFANAVDAAGNSTKTGWNQKGVAQVVKNNSAAMADVFADKPELLQRIKDTHDAGAILNAEDKSYGGADVQKRTLLSRGMEAASEKARKFGPAAVTATVTGPAAPLAVPIAQALGERWANSAKASKSLKDAQSRVTKLSEVGK
jgi:hypothetical protein